MKTYSAVYCFSWKLPALIQHRCVGDKATLYVTIKKKVWCVMPGSSFYFESFTLCIRHKQQEEVLEREFDCTEKVEFWWLEKCPMSFFCVLFIWRTHLGWEIRSSQKVAFCVYRQLRERKWKASSMSLTRLVFGIDMTHWCSYPHLTTQSETVIEQ